MARIADYTVEVYPETGDVVRQNPVPERAIETRTKQSAKVASNRAGIGRIDWKKVLSYSNTQINDFKEKMEIGNLLAGNAKTNKPRPSGRLGVIKGLNLAPHFYANLLNQTGVKKSGALQYVNKNTFNGFNGRTRADAVEGSGVPAKDLLDFCTGASKYCRQTCLVTTGQHPTTKQAAHAKLKFTFAFLEEPELFVALLFKQLKSFAKAKARAGQDAVVRLNMLSDLPWYEMCPELLEALDGSTDDGHVAFYDYTKLRFWESASYKRVEHLLDLTFSYSGTNDKDCERALKKGYRVAAVFAPLDPDRSTSILTRTTWEEILASGLVKRGKAELFGGRWLIVDGDGSDYRIDDPPASIVALNFKQPTISPEQVTHLKEALPESREHFTVKAARPGMSAAERAEWIEQSGDYASARARRQMWKQLSDDEFVELLERYPQAAKLDKETGDVVGLDPDKLPLDVVIAVSEQHPKGRKKNPGGPSDYYAFYGETIAPPPPRPQRIGGVPGGVGFYSQYATFELQEEEEKRKPRKKKRKNPGLHVLDTPDKQDDPSEVLDYDTVIEMAPIEGTSLLIGPHVPTVEDD
jgi:hypothetical protein